MTLKDLRQIVELTKNLQEDTSVKIKSVNEDETLYQVDIFYYTIEVDYDNAFGSDRNLSRTFIEILAEIREE